MRQKLLLLFFPILILISWPVIGQEDYMGVRFGYSNTQLNAENESDVELRNRNTWHGALTYSHIFKNNIFGFSVEPGYALKGTRTNRDTINYKLHYLSTPILIDFYPVKNLRLGFGPEVSFLLSGRNRINDTTKINIKESFDNQHELSGTISLSYSMSFFADFGVRYNRGFTVLTKSDGILNRRNLMSEYLQIFILLKIAN